MTLPNLIRIFISSTFLDMQAEREEVIRRIFPQLKKLCEQRRVILREVDLRWGIPQNEVDEGRLLPTCLAEVSNCHPFFIGFLGNRYGTRIGEISEDILEDKPWLRENLGKSLTELEILQGAFNDSNPKPYAFFYLRRPGDSESAGDFGDTDEESIRKLDDLKNRIRQSSFTVRDYENPRRLGELLLSDFTELFEKLFPAAKIPGDFERETLEQNAFTETLTHGYSGSQKYFDALDKHLKSRPAILIVSGDAGCGKSSLLANWVKKLQGQPVQIQSSSSFFKNLFAKIRRLFKAGAALEQPSKSLLITHFTGATEQSSDWANILRRILTTLRSHFQLSLEIPEAPYLLPTAFANFLQVIPKQEKVVIVIDAIDKINIDNAYSGFSWLPSEFPPNVKLILSASDSSNLSELDARRPAFLKIQPLAAAERETFITNYLEQYRKSLNTQSLRQIASVETTGNALYLRTLLEELRLVVRQTAELDKLSEYYLTAQNSREIFEKLIIRLEKDFASAESKTANLVRDTMRLLWTARAGLSEDELSELLGTPDNPLPAALWSPFYLAVKNHLLNRQGLLTFANDDFRLAVEKIYLGSDEEKERSYRRLAGYFKRRGSIARHISELPWHLVVLNEWSELAALLADPNFLSAAWKTRKYEIQSYWALIEAESPYKLIDAYRPLIDSPEQFGDGLRAVCSLLNDAGYSREVFRLAEYLESRARAQSDNAGLQTSLSLKAGLFKKQGELDKALAVLQENEAVCRRVANQTALAACYGNQAVIYYEKDYFEAALALHGKEEEIYRRLQDFVGLSISLGNQALNRQKQQDFKGALKLLEEQENLCRQLGDLSGLQKSLGNQGLIFWRTGKTVKAVEKLAKSEEICRKLNYTTELLICLGNQALVFESDGNYDKTDELFTEKEKICRETQNEVELAVTLLRHSEFYFRKLKVPDFALPLATEALQIAERHNDAKLRREIQDFIRTNL